MASTFDPHAAIPDLEAAGLDTRLAEAVRSGRGHLTTKADFAVVRIP